MLFVCYYISWYTTFNLFIKGFKGGIIMKHLLSTTCKAFTVLLCIAMLCTGCKPKDPEPTAISSSPDIASSTKKMVYQKEMLSIPEALGSPYYLARSGSQIFISGTNGVPTLAKYDCNTKEFDMLTIDSSLEDVKSPYGITSGPDAYIYLLTGDLPDVYMLGDEFIDNRDRLKVYCVLKYNPDGSFVERIPLPALDTSYPFGIVVDPDGNIISWDEETVFIFHPDGTEAGRIPSQNRTIMSIGLINDQILVHMEENEQSGMGQLALSIDRDSYLLENFSADPENVLEPLSAMRASYMDNHLLVNTDLALKAYYLEDVTGPKGHYETILSWSDLGLHGSIIASLQPIGDAQYCFIDAELDQVGIITGEMKDISEQHTLTIAAGDHAPELTKLIGKFKQLHPEYEVEVIPYEDEDEDGTTRLMAEILSGNVPDLIDLKLIHLNPQAQKKILADLTPYLMDASVDIIPELQNALQFDNAIYFLPDAFNVVSFTTPASLVPDMDGWNLSEMLSVFEASPYEHKFELLFNREVLLEYICDYVVNDMIDYENASCFFDQPEFIQWLELCKETYADYPDMTREERDAYDEKALMHLAYVRNLDVISSIRQLYNGDYQYIGFPSTQGNGNMFSFSGSILRLAMPQQSKQKDVAWEFISLMLTDEHQDIPWVNTMI